MAATKSPLSSRIIPDAFKLAHITMVGEAPLLMHADTLLDITHPLTREMKKLTGKRSSDRTIDDEMNMAKIEWHAGIYHDEELGPYVPSVNVKEMLAQAATRWRKGSTVTRTFIILTQKIPVEYDGPRDLDALWEDGYRDIRGAVNSGIGRGRVTRCRPCFEDWTLNIDVAYDPREVDTDVLKDALELAQWRGLGDYRPEFGTFAATWTDLKALND